MGKREDSEFLKAFIIFNRYKVCVEIGVWKGGTAIHLCEAAKLVGGHVYGFDTWTIHGLKKQYKAHNDASQTAVEKRLRAKEYDNFTLHTVDTTTQEFKDLLKSKCPKIDFAFIDACHSYPGVKNDFDIIYPLLSPTGSIAFHDTLTIDGCREFILDLRTKYFDGSYDIVDFPWGYGNRRCGLSILVKRQFPVVNLPIKIKCGSLSSPSEIIKREDEWIKEELQKYVPSQIDAWSLNIDKKSLGRL